jgi:YidC/Oxa1 family membrane protein insertase
VFFAFFPAGLVLYWLTNNLLSIGQQYYITRKIAAEAAKPGGSPPKASRRKQDADDNADDADSATADEPGQGLAETEASADTRMDSTSEPEAAQADQTSDEPQSTPSKTPASKSAQNKGGAAKGSRRKRPRGGKSRK